MAVTGQFGKVITGSGSVASAISGIASSYITLRLNRIYNAFINKESFEGREVTAAVAIELLNKMMAITTKGGKSQMDVEDTLRAVRKANRTRTLNEIDTTLKEQGANGDYANKVRVIEEMLLDPTLNPDDTDDLRDELNDAVDDLLVNTQNQFSAGGKVVINGKTIDFANGANEAEFLALYDDAIKRNPDASEKYNKERVIAQASVLVAKGNAAWLSKSRTTDALKSQGYTEQLKFLQQAYDLLKASPYGLATEAQNVLTNIRTIQENIATAKSNMAGTAASQRFSDGYDNIFADLDAINSAMESNPTIKQLLGDNSFSDLLSLDQNIALGILDQFTAINGNFVTRPDGTKIALTIENLSDIMKDSRVAAAALLKWSKNNPNVSAQDKKTIESWDKYATYLGKAAPILTVEDNYDDAVDDLSKAMDAAGADIGARAAALRDFGKRLNSIAGTSGIPKDIALSLRNEGNMYLTGERPADGATLYGDYSGNLTGENGLSGIYNAEEILGGIISPGVAGEAVSIFSAINSVFDQESSWIRGEGTVITDIDGNDVADTGTQDTTAWEKGQGVMIKTLGTITVGGTKITSFVDQNLQRMRIVTPGGQADPDNIGNYTVGWVSRVKQADGSFKYIVFSQDQNGDQRLLKGDAAQSFISTYLKGGNWQTLVQRVGGNLVIGVNADAGAALRGSDTTGDTLDATALSDGSIWDLISNPNNGYGWAAEYQATVDESIRKAVKAGTLIVRNGRILIPGAGQEVGGAQGGTRLDLDITNMVSDTMRAKILELFPTVDTKTGESEGTDSTSGGQEVRTGKDRWAGTQWAGQEGSTVIAKDASGRDLTLDQAFSGGTGYMWDTSPKKTGSAGPNGVRMNGRGIAPATKAKLDAEMAKYDRARAQAVRGTGMSNVVTGGISRAQQADEGGRMLQTFMRNMPTVKGGGVGLPKTGTKYKPIARNRNI